MHFSDVLTGHGFDYKAVVVAGQEAVAEATLGVAVERGAPRQRVLPRFFFKSRKFKLPKTSFTSKHFHLIHR